MQDVLLNLANLHLLQYCKEQGIDPSGSHVEKTERGFVYGLIGDDGDKFVSVMFTKNTTPQFSWHNAARKRGK